MKAANESLLSPNEWRHIAAMNERFPYLKNAFRAALAVSLPERHEWAIERLKNLPRSGPLSCGVPREGVGSVYDHIEEMKTLSRVFAQGAISSSCQRLAQAMIDVHDLPEAITGDFHRHDPITKEEKRRLEASALKIILAHDPGGLRLAFHSFEAAKHPAARWVKDLDYLQCMHRTLEYQTRFPSLRQNLNEFWDGADEKRLMTPTGQRMLESLLIKRKELLFSVP